MGRSRTLAPDVYTGGRVKEYSAASPAATTVTTSTSHLRRRIVAANPWRSSVPSGGGSSRTRTDRVMRVSLLGHARSVTATDVAAESFEPTGLVRPDAAPVS